MPLWNEKTQRNLPLLSNTSSNISQNIQDGEKVHILVQNMVNKSGQITDLNCYLCSLIKKQKLRTNYGCAFCRKGFHVNCFAAFHHQDKLNSSTRNFVEMAIHMGGLENKPKIKKQCKTVGGLAGILF